MVKPSQVLVVLALIAGLVFLGGQGIVSPPLVFILIIPPIVILIQRWRAYGWWGGASGKGESGGFTPSPEKSEWLDSFTEQSDSSSNKNAEASKDD